MSLLAALHALRSAANTNLDRTTEILRRLDHIESRLAAGERFRSAQARSLHAEGMTMNVIAKLFGVTRQRISALLR